MIDSLVYFYQSDAAWTQRSAMATDNVPHFGAQQLIQHIYNVYYSINQDILDSFGWGSNITLDFAKFLTLADELDGQTDTQLKLPDLKGLYHLWVEQRIPLPAIGYNIREKNQWSDRRSVLKSPSLEGELPKSIRRLKHKSLDEAQKLEAVMKFILKRITAIPDGKNTDFWQTPFETLLLGEGDCEDFAILFHSIASWLDIPTHVVLGHCVRYTESGRPVKQGHAWLQYRGRLIDPLASALGNVQYEAKIQFNAEEAQFVNPKGPRSKNNDLFAMR